MKVTFKVADNRAAAGGGGGQQTHLPAAVNSPRRSILPPLPSADDEVDADDDALSEDNEDDVISRSVNSHGNSNAYVRPIEDTRTFRGGLDQLYGGSEASQRRDGGWREQGGKHLPSTLSAAWSLRPPGGLLVLLLGLLVMLRIPRGHMR